MFLRTSVALATALTIVPLVSFAQQTPTVIVDGTGVTFDQPPIERAGRVFVPLRGVFERLGASVVFADGQINATQGPHTIALHLGSSTAVVDGVAQTLDSPPLLVAGRTLVPLRFLSQALGAAVNYDPHAQAIYVVRSAPPAASSMPPPPVAVTAPPPPDRIALRLLRLEPARDTTIERKRPELSATFAEPVEPNTIRVTIDDRDVTPEAYVSDRSFVYDPNFDLPPGPHTVGVAGKTADREAFREHWTFTSRDNDLTNYISGLEPPNGTHVGSAFTVSAFTRPKARVRIVVTTSEIANFSDVTGGSSTTDVVADDHGYFEAKIELPEHVAGVADLRIASTAPDESLAVRTLRLQP